MTQYNLGMRLPMREMDFLSKILMPMTCYIQLEVLLRYYHDPAWETIVQKAMEKDNSWAQSAFKYNQLYAELISRSETHVF